MVRVRRGSRHIRWNWEKAPLDERGGEENLSRVHIVIVDNKYHEGLRDQILGFLGGEFKTLNPVRDPRRGRVKGTNFTYLFATYDCSTSPDKIDFKRLVPRRQVVKDTKLVERVGGDRLDNYVAKLYWPD